MDFPAFLYYFMNQEGGDMKRTTPYIVFCIILSFALGGCLDLEATRLNLDIENERAEVIYKNIVSSATTDEQFTEDMNILVRTAFMRKGDTEESAIVSSELYEEDGHLNGRRTFVVKDMDKFLEQFDMKKDYRGYVMDIRDDSATYVDGNGTYIESSAGRQVIWDRDSQVVEVELRYDMEGKRLNSLLPYWKKWREWDTMGGPDAVSLLRQELGDAVKPDSDENSIDYCTDGTCYSFSTNYVTEGAFNRLSDFAYLYLYYMLDDASLEGFKASGEDYALKLLYRNMLDCPKTTAPENARCAMRNLTSTYSMELRKIEYEEMEKKVSPVDLKKELGVTGRKGR
jgi:hypothetical protein